VQQASLFNGGGPAPKSKATSGVRNTVQHKTPNCSSKGVLMTSSVQLTNQNQTGGSRKQAKHANPHAQFGLHSED
jgi:hypothetical protein